MFTISNEVKVSYLGPQASFTHEAALKVFKNLRAPISYIPKPSIREVFRSVEIGECSYGVVPIENSIEGTVGEVIDLLAITPLRLVCETELRIKLCLIAMPNTKLRDIHTVVSHPHALAQCRGFLEEVLGGVKVEVRSSTSEAVKEAVGKYGVAAIGSRYAAEVYGGEVIAEGIEDYGGNYTRFIVVGNNELDIGVGAKTAIVFTLPHRPGTLYNALRPFALRRVNLTKIESRPIKGRPWEYMFYMEFEGSLRDSEVASALNELKENTITLKVLGSFRRVD